MCMCMSITYLLYIYVFTFLFVFVGVNIFGELSYVLIDGVGNCWYVDNLIRLTCIESTSVKSVFVAMFVMGYWLGMGDVMILWK